MASPLAGSFCQRASSSLFSGESPGTGGKAGGNGVAVIPASCGLRRPSTCRPDCISDFSCGDGEALAHPASKGPMTRLKRLEQHRNI